MKKVLGPNNGIYKGMMSGLNKDNEFDFEAALLDLEKREVLIAKSCVQLIIDGYTLSEEDIVQRVSKIRCLLVSVST